MGGGRPDGRTLPAVSASGTLGVGTGRKRTEDGPHILNAEPENLGKPQTIFYPRDILANHGKPWGAKPEANG